MLRILTSISFQLFDVLIQFIKMLSLLGEFLLQLPQTAFQRHELESCVKVAVNLDLRQCLSIPLLLLLSDEHGLICLLAFGPAITVVPGHKSAFHRQ